MITPQQLVEKKAILFLNSLHNKDKLTFSSQFIYPGDFVRWPFLNVLPGAVIVNDSAKLVLMHEGWFAHPECSFGPYVNSMGLDREFISTDLIYCEPVVAQSFIIIRCGVNAHVVKEKQLGDNSSEIITSRMHISMLFAFDQTTNNWWITQINNTPI